MTHWHLWRGPWAFSGCEHSLGLGRCSTGGGSGLLTPCSSRCFCCCLFFSCCRKVGGGGSFQRQLSVKTFLRGSDSPLVQSHALTFVCTWTHCAPRSQYCVHLAFHWCHLYVSESGDCTVRMKALCFGRKGITLRKYCNRIGSEKEVLGV